MKSNTFNIRNLIFYHTKKYRTHLTTAKVHQRVNSWLEKQPETKLIKITPPWEHENPPYQGKWLSDNEFLIRRHQTSGIDSSNPFRPQIKGVIKHLDTHKTEVSLEFGLNDWAIGMLAFAVLIVTMFALSSNYDTWYHPFVFGVSFMVIFATLFYSEYWLSERFICNQLQSKE